MSDADIIASAREAELRALFAILHKGLGGGDAFAAENFAHGLRVLACAENVALKALCKFPGGGLEMSAPGASPTGLSK